MGHWRYYPPIVNQTYGLFNPFRHKYILTDVIWWQRLNAVLYGTNILFILVFRLPLQDVFSSDIRKAIVGL